MTCMSVIMYTCTLYAGCLAFSAIMLYSLFWFIFIVHLFLKVTFPFQSIKLDKSEHSKKYHIIEVVCALIVGTVPNITFAATSKFQFTTFPPYSCGTGPAYNFYGTIVPTILVNCVNLILMLLVVYKIHKVRYLISSNEHRNVYNCVYNCITYSNKAYGCLYLDKTIEL